MLIAQIFLAGFLIMSLSLIGKLFTYGVLRGFVHRHFKFITTSALGVFVANLYILLNEDLVRNILSTDLVVYAVICIFVLVLIRIYFADAHHHHGVNPGECFGTHECQSNHYHEKVHPSSMINPVRILLGDSMHNIADGILLSIAFLSNPQAGVVLTVGILLHEFTQETSEFFILKEAGYSTRKALIANFAVSSTLILGIIAGMLSSQAIEYASILSALSLGVLIYIIFADLLPYTLMRLKRDGGILAHSVIFAISACVIILSSQVL